MMRYAPSGQVAHDAEQDLRLPLGQRGGRLVQDQHAAIERQRLGDLDQLLLGDREVRTRVEGRYRTVARGPRLPASMPL